MMPTDKTVPIIKTAIITITLLVGLFILSYVSEVNSRSKSPFECLISDEDYITDEPDLCGLKSDFSMGFIKKDSKNVVQASEENNDFFKLHESLFTLSIDIMPRFVSKSSEKGFCSISHHGSLQIKEIITATQTFFDRCRSQ